MASASCCSFLKFGQPKKWFRGYIVFGNSVKGNVYLLLWKSCFSETSSAARSACVKQASLDNTWLSISASLSLSRSPHFCRYVGICVHSVSLFSVHVPLYSYYIYIYMLSIKYLNSCIDISILYWYSNRTYSLYQSQMLSIIVATPSFFAEPENLRKTISCLYTRLCSQ